MNVLQLAAFFGGQKMNDAASKNEQHTLSVVFGRQSAWIVLLLGFVISAAATLYMKSNVNRIARQEFIFKCNDIKDDIAERLADHARILRSGASFFDASDSVTRKEWHTYTDRQNLEQQLPGIQGLGFSLLIPKVQLGQHTRQIRSEGFPEYQVKPEGDPVSYTHLTLPTILRV